MSTAAFERRAMYPSLEHKRVVVTGGGSGIGATIVEAFARQRAQVTFLDIAEADSRALERDLGGLPVRPVYLPCDLTDVQALKHTFDGIQRKQGAVQVLVNNAANDDRHRLEDVTSKYWDDRIAVNLRHLFFSAQAVAPAMKAAGAGVIINLGSISWHLGLKDLAIYQTAKAGVEGFTRALARELGAAGVRVVCVVPGAVRTPRQSKLWLTPAVEADILAAQCIHDRVEPLDIAAMVLFLASEDARLCTAHEYFVDAGWC
jgi:NAD(P)-dependent dehydrogenase (short-subunit alcohol dehydrogenase family)